MLKEYHIEKKFQKFNSKKTNSNASKRIMYLILNWLFKSRLYINLKQNVSKSSKIYTPPPCVGRH